MLRSEVVWFPKLIDHLSDIVVKLQPLTWWQRIQYDFLLHIVQNIRQYRELNQFLNGIKDRDFRKLIQTQVIIVQQTCQKEDDVKESSEVEPVSDLL